MAEMAPSAFSGLNLMAGTARSLQQENLSSEDKQVWDRDFQILVDDLTDLTDEQLGKDLAAEKDFYTGACQVAKGYFDEKPFGGLKAATGQYGFRLIGPQDLKTTSAGGTPAFYSWVQTVTTTSGKSYKTGALGFGGSNVYARDAANKAAVIGFHRLLSYKPNPKLVNVEFNVNGYPYMPYAVHQFSKVEKAQKLFRVIPMPGRILLHPGGYFYATFYFDLETGATAPSGTNDVDIEIGPFGLVFAEYDYLAGSELT